MLAESPRVGDGRPIRRDSYLITTTWTSPSSQTDRRSTTSFEQAPRHPAGFRMIPFSVRSELAG